MLNQADMKYICTIIGNLSGIPVRFYHEDQLIYLHSVVHLPKDPMLLFKDEIWQKKDHVSYFITQQFHYYGIVIHDDDRFIIGPTKQTPNNEQELRKLAFNLEVAPNDTDQFINAMNGIIRIPFDSILQMLCSVNFIVNHEKLELKDVAIYEEEQTQLQNTQEKESVNQFYNENKPEQNPSFDRRSAYEIEQDLLQMIRKGDLDALNAWVSTAPAIRGGVMAMEQIRQMKNTFITSATLVARAAIQGGLLPEDAFNISDSYICEVETLQSPEKIMNLQYHMVLDFAQRVHQILANHISGKLAKEVNHYIQHHLSQRITVADIAKELYLSRPYLSKQFKEETNENLTDYILQQKVEEAKRLLRYSDKPITAISYYLSFSSPGHLSRVFKRYTNQTPKEYRSSQ